MRADARWLEQLKPYARSDGYEDSQKAWDEPKRIAEEDLDCEWFGEVRVHAKARRHLRQSEASKGAFTSDEDHLLLAATPVVAEFKVSRSCGSSVAGAYIFQTPSAAHTQIAGWRRGRQLGLTSFLAIE